MLKSWFKHLVVFITASVAVLGIAVVLGFVLMNGENESTSTEVLQSYRWIFMTWRILVIALIVGFWPVISRWLAQRYQANHEQLQQLLSLRWKIGGLLIILDLVLVENIFSILINLV